MLHEGIGDSIEIMNLYLMLLVQTHEYGEVVSAIEGLLESEYIPNDQLQNFNRLLHFSQRMLDNPIEKETKSSLDEVAYKELNLFQYQDPLAQMGLVEKLNNHNIQPYLKEMIAYLQSNEGGPFFKSLILNVLKEHSYDKPVEIQKFGRKVTVIPENLSNMDDNLQLKGIFELIGQKLEHEDPILYDNIKRLVERQFFLLFPFQLESDDIESWAAAYHALGNEYYGNSNNDRELMDEYQVVQADLNRANSFIRMIEEISYRDI